MFHKTRLGLLILAVALAGVLFNGEPLSNHASATTVAVSNQKGQNLFTYSEQFDKAAWVKRGAASVTANQTQAPDGTMTADLVSGIGTSAVDDIYNAAYGASIGAPGARYELSMWVKRVSVSGTLRVVSANLGMGYSVDLSLIGDGWVRIRPGAPGVSTYQNPLILEATVGAGGIDIYAGSGGPLSFYAWGAQEALGTESGAYSKTAASSVGSSYVPRGKTTSSQRGQNLHTYSEQLGNTAGWSQANVTMTSNNVAAPDGTMTADTIVESTDGAPASHLLSQSTVNASGILTTSGYFKAVNGQWLMIAQDGGGVYQFFDVLNCTVGTTHVGAGWISAAAKPAGSGWCRFSITGSVGSNQQTRVYLGSADGTFSYTGTGVARLAVWGMQVVKGTSAGAYSRTVASAVGPSYVPAGATQSSQLGQNLITKSETISAWATDAAGATSTADVVLAPDGTKTADQIAYPAGGGFIYSPTSASPVHTTGTRYTMSIWLWSSSTTKAQIGMRAYSLPLGANGGVKTIVLTTTPTRYSITFPIIRADDVAGLVLDLENRVGYGSDGLAGTMYAWGGQIVVGSKPGAYNKTTTATVNPNYLP